MTALTPVVLCTSVLTTGWHRHLHQSLVARKRPSRLTLPKQETYLPLQTLPVASKPLWGRSLQTLYALSSSKWHRLLHGSCLVLHSAHAWPASIVLAACSFLHCCNMLSWQDAGCRSCIIILFMLQKVIAGCVHNSAKLLPCDRLSCQFPLHIHRLPWHAEPSRTSPRLRAASRRSTRSS